MARRAKKTDSDSPPQKTTVGQILFAKPRKRMLAHAPFRQRPLSSFRRRTNALIGKLTDGAMHLYLDSLCGFLFFYDSTDGFFCQ